MSSTESQKPISEDMVLLCKELQAVPILDSFYLGGGTALAMYLKHRESNDIDLISSKALTKKEIFGIIDELNKHFGNRIGKIFLNDIDENGTPIPDNLLFIRCFIQMEKSSKTIMVELIQNVYCNNLDPIVKNDIKVLPIELIAILKMAAAIDRAANKDIYDMYFLTKNNRTALQTICENFDQYKQHILDNKEKISLFDQLIIQTPIIKDPSPLFTFEHKKKSIAQSLKLPMHSNHEVKPINGNCNYQVAASQFRIAINNLFLDLGIELPNQKGISIGSR